ncbi:MAG: hypothetical protein A2X81_11280 [Desulfobacterales bacterium GWB2_56_26]|nr:MAG: hypothetical protein A2X81_11280 [Desulfobacterales bacterium GWB2_56_26]HBG19555.1 hypothetical protein [Desulfobulbaceae bacterium]
MRILTFVPVIVSSLLAAAHFYRSGFLLVAAFCMLLPWLMLVRHRLVPRLLTPFLLLCGLEWLRTLYVLTGRYQEAGLSATRMTVILVTVSLIAILSPLVFRTQAMRRRYQPEQVTAR